MGVAIKIPCPECHKRNMIKTFYIQGNNKITILVNNHCYKCGWSAWIDHPGHGVHGSLDGRTMSRIYQKPRKFHGLEPNQHKRKTR